MERLPCSFIRGAMGKSMTNGGRMPRFQTRSSIGVATLMVCALLLCPGGVMGQHSSQATIQVDASKVRNRITPWMIGSCIEDVNHEIYGGLYAQMIFGESFEEPPQARSPLAGWKAYGGQWRVEEGALHVAPDAGAKLVRD